jgi:uncharacterized RDD family membrane protein YckC
MAARDKSSPGLEPTMLSLGGKAVSAPSPTDAPDPLLGTRLRHFEVVRLLGRGGMGSVYLGHDTSLDRAVALKVLAPEIAHDPEVVARFEREARAQARLVHPNVTQIYFIGEDNGVHFFAMEYVEGPALDTVLEGKLPIPWPDAVEYAIAAAKGLRAALGEGFIHRDVKPSNLMLDKESRVKILDFGLVKSMRGDAELTRDGAIVGSPLYMAPEQGRAESVDHRADIYSLGCALYHLLTGAPPFTAPSPVGVISMHVTEKATPVRAIKPEVPDALERVVEKMMAKDPAARPGADGGYDALIAMLEACRPGTREYTGFKFRAMALGVDLVPFIVLARFVGLWSGLAAALYFILCHKLAGQTFGKWLFRLQVTDDNGARIGWKSALLRFGVFAWAPAIWVAMGVGIYFIHRDDHISFQLGHLGKHDLIEPLSIFTGWLITFIGYLSGFLLAAFHPKHRALHDLVGKTEVTYRVRAPKRRK